MKVWIACIASIAISLSTQACAESKASMAAGQALAQKNNCMACHKNEGKLVGPGFKEVAAKYKGNKSAEEVLAAKVSKGGAGTWGTVAMPPNPSVKPDDMKKLMAWVLNH